VDEHVRFSTEVTGAAWVDDHWEVLLDSGETLSARAVISAVGQLNRPWIPDVPGDFAGPQFHTARWDHSVDLTGKDVVMVGAGATGFQVAPTIADQVKSLTVIQRTAQWMFPNPNYHERVGPGVRWALKHLPFYGRWYRFLIFWPGCDTGLEAARIDPSYPHQQTAVSEVNEITRQMFTDWIVSQVGDDEELRQKVVPDYPPTGKRTLQDNGSWLRCLTRPNVELVRAAVQRLETDAVVDSNGDRHVADVVVWATGFRPNEMLFPMTITGRDGRDLRKDWGHRPKAYLGMTVPGFPNFFMMYGPGTNLASGGSLIFHSECEIRYIVQCLQALDGHTAMEPRQDKHDEWYERCQRELKTLVWSSPHIEHSFYKNADGDVHCLSPWRLVDFWTWTRTPDLDDFVLT
jgi:4-hydroxyacetophenone monooxygenase